MKDIQGTFVPLSFVDYPGYMSFVIFLKGCDLNCSYCYNKFKDTELYSITNILYNKLPLRTEAVVISGGEPLFHAKSLKTIVNIIRKLSERKVMVGLHTSGIPYGRFKSNFRIFDWIGLDYKQPEGRDMVTKYRNYHNMFSNSLDILIKSGVPFCIRTTVTNEFTELDMNTMRAFLKSKNVLDKWTFHKAKESGGFNV